MLDSKWLMVNERESLKSLRESERERERKEK
jgi:hypothetical protein